MQKMKYVLKPTDREKYFWNRVLGMLREGFFEQGMAKQLKGGQI
jgi:hypothetical protein